MAMTTKRKASKDRGIAHDIKRGVKKVGRKAGRTMDKAKEKTQNIWEDIKE